MFLSGYYIFFIRAGVKNYKSIIFETQIIKYQSPIKIRFRIKATLFFLLIQFLRNFLLTINSRRQYSPNPSERTFLVTNRTNFPLRNRYNSPSSEGQRAREVSRRRNNSLLSVLQEKLQQNDPRDRLTSPFSRTFRALT